MRITLFFLRRELTYGNENSTSSAFCHKPFIDIIPINLTLSIRDEKTRNFAIHSKDCVYVYTFVLAEIAETPARLD